MIRSGRRTELLRASRKSKENLLWHAEPNCAWKKNERYPVTVRKGTSYGIVFRSLCAQDGSHETDFRQMDLRRRLRPVTASLTASRGQNPSDAELKPYYLTVHASS